MEYYAMLALHCVDDMTNIDKIQSSLVMYPFESKKEMMEFQDCVNRIYSGEFCDDCERFDDIERDESRE